MALDYSVIVLAVVLIAVAVFLVLHFKQLLANTALGVIALLAINYFGGSYGLNVPLNIITVVVCAALGLAGAGLLLILSYFGIKL